MDSIFNTENKEKKYTQITLSKTVISKLKDLNKGSMNDTVDYLLGSKDNRIESRIKQTEQDVAELQEKLERMVSLNKLRI
jgi:hypothetical protein